MVFAIVVECESSARVPTPTLRSFIELFGGGLGAHKGNSPALGLGPHICTVCVATGRKQRLFRVSKSSSFRGRP